MMRSLCLIGMVIIGFISPVTSMATEQPSLIKSAESAILLEVDTGTVLYDQEADKRLPPASMTKLMSMLLFMEALDEGELSLDDTVQVSENAASMGGSQIYLEAFEEMTVKELLKAVAIASANDATVALAEEVAVTEQAFIDRMNEKARALGLENTQFQNTTGLPEDDHYSTANDMAVIARALLDHESITDYTKVYEDYLRQGTEDEFWLVNTNRLVKFYQGLDGLKTGYTDEAEYCLTATAKRGDMRVVSVVMGAETPQKRNADTTALLDYAFSEYQVEPLYAKGESVYQFEDVKADRTPIHLSPKRDITLLMNKGESSEQVETEISLKSAEWPIKKGDVLGKMTVRNQGDVINQTDLIVRDPINEASTWTLWKRLFNQLNN
ncbi:D-alanyl-D-alanine carboxypeptidase (penicillin-binding protein 5/6) [Alkalibacillus flavidus]|uniref:serine-type D-Ala-D-Ala carboxypeptidase n=1 Tax=Alkalibacillus flavidus TaxID=546021 RepID=A0ABV2KS28_9BACI